MTTIVADIRDSQGNSFNGYIQITLDYNISDPGEAVGEVLLLHLPENVFRRREV